MSIIIVSIIIWMIVGISLSFFLWRLEDNIRVGDLPAVIFGGMILGPIFGLAYLCDRILKKLPLPSRHKVLIKKKER